jgi:hypothetical protein
LGSGVAGSVLATFVRVWLFFDTDRPADVGFMKIDLFNVAQPFRPHATLIQPANRTEVEAHGTRR